MTTSVRGAKSREAKNGPRGDPWLSPDERHQLGRSRRQVLPRSTLAEFVRPENRPDPVTLLESQAVSRIPELVPIRYGRMLASPLAFFRGAALIMASDLAAGPRTGLQAQLCGDTHLCNFGLFGTSERNLVFDINDFDETLPGPWEWDVKRLASSLAVAARTNGFTPDDREQVVRSSMKAYRKRMRTLAMMGELDVWYAQARVDAALQASVSPKEAKEIQHTADKARSHDSTQALTKLTRVVDGRRQLVSDPPLQVPVDEYVSEAEARIYELRTGALIDAYRKSLNVNVQVLAHRFRCAGTARKVVGVGSVGLRTWVVLALGRDDDDPLVMQVKEAQPSVLEPYLGPSAYPNAAQRVVVGQREIQASGDILLGWLRTVGPDGHLGDYYVRQLRDWKESATVEAMDSKMLTDYGRACGEVLAGAHARTGDRIAIAGYLGSGDAADTALTRFAEAYAEQNERDYAALREAVRSGRVAAEQ
ncbi:MAG TPA: DUF2252 domain-containing protein [Mycobacterium sp.]|nr:DUF2252 domain-containing protein [Mycobacterium sp.]HME80192.1 DUF2252 domain-containing protein [Mycobacterium sp.]